MACFLLLRFDTVQKQLLVVLRCQPNRYKENTFIGTLRGDSQILQILFHLRKFHILEKVARLFVFGVWRKKICVSSLQVSTTVMNSLRDNQSGPFIRAIKTTDWIFVLLNRTQDIISTFLKNQHQSRRCITEKATLYHHKY